MPEGPEHEFLKNEFAKVLADFATTRLYGYTETQRRRFDLACLIDRDWSQPLVGEVLWKHSAGLEKDLRLLLSEPEAEIKVYIVRDTIPNRAAFESVIGDYRRSGRFPDLFKLKSFWIPADFDADRTQDQSAVEVLLKSEIVDDLLFNVVFGNLQRNDVLMFLKDGGRLGLNLAVLHSIATRGFFNVPDLRAKIGGSAGPIRERLQLLRGLGLISSPPRALMFEATTKGRVLLELFSRCLNDRFKLSPELKYILGKVGCIPPSTLGSDLLDPEGRLFLELHLTIDEAQRNFGVDLSTVDYSQKREFTV